MRLSYAATAAALVIAAACSENGGTAQSPLSPTPPRVPPANPVMAVVTLVSGDGQHAKAGEFLAEPFVVKVTDRDGDALSDVAVWFNLASGVGTLGGPCDGGPKTAASARSGQDGLARVSFQPTALGRSTVTAQVAGSQDAPVTFTTEASVIVIEFWFGIWGAGFISPCPAFSRDVTVPVGATVEWNAPAEDDRFPMTYTVTSTSMPAGGMAFDSGTLKPQQRFSFVPVVAGTWEYVDRVTGLTGSLTAR